MKAKSTRKRHSSAPRLGILRRPAPAGGHYSDAAWRIFSVLSPVASHDLLHFGGQDNVGALGKKLGVLFREFHQAGEVDSPLQFANSLSNVSILI